MIDRDMGPASDALGETGVRPRPRPLGADLVPSREVVASGEAVVVIGGGGQQDKERGDHQVTKRFLPLNLPEEIHGVAKRRPPSSPKCLAPL